MRRKKINKETKINKTKIRKKTKIKKENRKSMVQIDGSKKTG